MVKCSYILSRGPRKDEECGFRATGPLPFCTQHLKTKRGRKALEIDDEGSCKWLVITNRDQRRYLKAPRICGKALVAGTHYCLTHLFLGQAWDETIKGIPPRCNHIIRNVNMDRVCPTEVKPGYKKCMTHARGRGRPPKSLKNKSLRTPQSAKDELREELDVTSD